MSRRGSNTSQTSSKSVVPLVLLFGIPLAIYMFLKNLTSSSKPASMSKPSDIFSILQQTGLNEALSKFAVAQAAHETAGFTSAVFLGNNNCFGMKYSGQVNSRGEKNGYADYADVNHSVADFVAWYTRHRSSVLSLPLYIGSIESYVKFLKNNKYFEDSESVYLEGCLHYYNLYFK